MLANALTELCLQTCSILDTNLIFRLYTLALSDRCFSYILILPFWVTFAFVGCCLRYFCKSHRSKLANLVDYFFWNSLAFQYLNCGMLQSHFEADKFRGEKWSHLVRHLSWKSRRCGMEIAFPSMLTSWLEGSSGFLDLEDLYTTCLRWSW